MIRRYVISVVVSAACLFLWMVGSPPIASAAGASFQTVQFNLCSRHCTEDATHPGGSYTNYGINPVVELHNAIAIMGDPRVISLNEVCSPAAFVFTGSLPANAYWVNFVITKHVGGTCGEFGNIIAVRTFDIGYSQSHTFNFWYGHTTPPPSGSSAEWRGGTCSESQVYLENFGGCTSHLDGSAPGTAASYRVGVDGWYPSRPRIALGDFNLTPGQWPVPDWFNDAYIDADQGFTVTYEGGGNHIDYAMFGAAQIAGPDAGGAAFSSSSDHHDLFSPVHFK